MLWRDARLGRSYGEFPLLCRKQAVFHEDWAGGSGPSWALWWDARLGWKSAGPTIRPKTNHPMYVVNGPSCFVLCCAGLLDGFGWFGGAGLES